MPKVSWRKLSWMDCTPRNSWKFSPLKASCFTSMASLDTIMSQLLHSRSNHIASWNRRSSPNARWLSNTDSSQYMPPRTYYVVASNRIYQRLSIGYFSLSNTNLPVPWLQYIHYPSSWSQHTLCHPVPGKLINRSTPTGCHP